MISWYASITFIPRANCFINEFLSALTSLFVRPHSSPVSRATETSHRVQGRGQDKDKRRTRPGHRARPQRTRPSHRAQPQRTRGGQGLDTEPSHRGQGPATEPSQKGQEEDKAWTQSPATEDKRRTRPGHRAQPQSPTEFRGAASECGQLFFSKIEPQQ